MARCGCASAGCNCVVASSPTTTVSGDGSQATPYMVDVSCESIQDCVGNSLACGLQYNDAANTIGVQLSAQGGNTIQCLPDGLFSTPGAVAIGCGLTTNGGGQITVDTLPFTSLTTVPCDDGTGGELAPVALDPACELQGVPVYCDINGNLRTKPEKFTVADSTSATDAYVPAVTALPFTGNEITLSITNPSSCYCMCGYLDVSLIPALSGAPGTVIQIIHDIDRGTGVYGSTQAYNMDNRGKTANASAENVRHPVQLQVCLDPGETKVFRHRVRMVRFTGDNGGAISITSIAHDLRYVGTNT